MNRKIVVNDVADPAYQLVKPLEVELVPTDAGFVAEAAGIPVTGEGKTQSEALTDFQDSLVGAIQAGALPPGVLRARSEDAQARQFAPAVPPTAKCVYVLIAKQDTIVRMTVEAVVTDKVWAKRWKRMGGDFIELVLDKFPGDDDE